MTTIHVMTTGETRNPIGSCADMLMTIAVGFGAAYVTRDGKHVLDGEDVYRRRKRLLVFHAETRARRSPRSKWQIVMHAPLWNATWERRGRNRWVCVESGMGFA